MSEDGDVLSRGRSPRAAPKRTNSLGWADSDCHTCRAQNRRCDRRRPMCDTCMDAGVRCHGFKLKLDWQPGIASRGKMKQIKLSMPADHSQGVRRAGLDEARSFTFVSESGEKTKGRRGRRKTAKPSPSPALSDRGLPSPAGSSEVRGGEIFADDDDNDDDKPPDCEAAVAPATPQLCRQVANPLGVSAAASEMIRFYEWRFSFVTLTFDVRTNPWQMCLPMAFDHPCLMDGIVALARRHRSRLLEEAEGLEVIRLKDRALRSFGRTLGRVDARVALATILVLIGLDYAESAFSHWSVHLAGARNVIESSGGIGIARRDSPLRCQIAMLAWYDVTCALMARRRSIFPRRYMEAIMGWRSRGEWSLMALNGYPDDLFIDIYDISEAAAATGPGGGLGVREEKAAALERRLWTAQAHGGGSGGGPEGDTSSLLECWRLGLLLYCARVLRTPRRNPFLQDSPPGDSPSASPSPAGSPSSPAPVVAETPPPPPPVPSAVDRCKSYAEEILRIVAELPPTSHFQKQCLLPLILAGCEMTAEQEGFRAMIAEYCHRWGSFCGLGIYKTAMSVMTTVWTLLDGGHVDDSVWWGDLVRDPGKLCSQSVIGDGGLRWDAEKDRGKELLFG
ncbi:hypothetical protein NKR23_g8009 [Pleurostoma richardsiae]|uniref:Zn(2)-C6 fungal-type domain-containing protein n=1 Tax=Pleurostoma richardsiae TaxID=41990 RepID=A0AA38VLZ3_9PEZI|nr:hypothetical protein NKR23_g8009 [Pleurostoma richardsiae]